MSITLEAMLARWDSEDGHPYKGSLIDLEAYAANPTGPGCMCAQGQVLHYMGGLSVSELSALAQSDADAKTAKLLGISTAHSVLLRKVNASQSGAPSIVLTHPEQVLGDQAHIVLAFWRHLDRMTDEQWEAARTAAWTAAREVAREAARGAAREAARTAAWEAARGAAREAAGGAAREAAGAAAGEAARQSAWAASYACSEIQGAAVMRANGQPFYFLPMFGFADPEAVLAANADAPA